MAEKQYEALKLENQLCFPLYAAAREVIKLYRPHLDSLDLTYTQYITMMVMWEAGQTTSREIGERLRLDSGTLTPVLKKLADSTGTELGEWNETEGAVVTAGAKKPKTPPRPIPCKRKK